MASNDDKLSAPNDPATGLISAALTWFNDRTPGLMPVYRKHLSEYYAPRMMYSTDENASAALGLKCIVRKMPVTIWLTSTSSASEPK